MVKELPIALLARMPCHPGLACLEAPGVGGLPRSTIQASPARVKVVYFAVQGHWSFRKSRGLQRVKLRIGSLKLHELLVGAKF
jgi:hypothetical protein